MGYAEEQKRREERSLRDNAALIERGEAIGLFSNVEAAQFSRQLKGVMGRNMTGTDDTNLHVVRIFKSVEEYVEALPIDDPLKKKWLMENDPSDYQLYVQLRQKFEGK